MDRCPGDGERRWPLELLAAIIALKPWGRDLKAKDRDVIVGMPFASDNLANVYIVGKMYTSAQPLSQLLREFAATCAASGVVPAALHLPGAAHVVPDRLSRGFVSAPSLAALGLQASGRRRSTWQPVHLWCAL